MKFSDQGIIINIKNYGENSAIIKLFSQENGVYCGFVKSIKSTKSKAIFQLGNVITFEYKSRLEENLGSFSRCDLVKSYCTKILFDKKKLKIATSLLHLIDNVILEKLALEELFHRLAEFLHKLTTISDIEVNLANYIILELNILKILGYEIDLSSCVATGVTTNLKYVSPKSARAVSFEAGKQYEKKMLILPEFFLDESSIPSQADLENGLALTRFFFCKFIHDGDQEKMKFQLNSLRDI